MIKRLDNIEAGELQFRLDNKNDDFTLIARDCIGGILYHQLGLKFLTPTINLFLTPKDFNSLCLHLREYINGELKEFKNHKEDYPVGMLYPDKIHNLEPIRIDFMHYLNFDEASTKWNQRKLRINWDNIYVVSSFCYIGETKTFTPELVRDWNQINYKKVVFVDKKYGFDDEIVMEEPKECDEYAWLLFADDESQKWKRVFNRFDFIKFLNE